VATSGLVLIRFLLVWDSFFGPNPVSRFSGKPVSAFLLCFILGVVGLD